jgi:GNAT superfamily N-acetyltransferase
MQSSVWMTSASCELTVRGGAQWQDRGVRIALLADHPEHVEALACWHCEHDGRRDDADWFVFWRNALRRESGRDRIPIAFVALDGDAIVGGVSLVEANMTTHPELSPWLAGTLVHQSRRGEGVGAQLVAHATARAATLGVRRLYLYTERARGFYEKPWPDVPLRRAVRRRACGRAGDRLGLA